MSKMTLIDSPITPFSSVAEIDVWIAKLKSMKDEISGKEYDEAMRRAESYLERAKRFEQAEK